MSKSDVRWKKLQEAWSGFVQKITNIRKETKNIVSEVEEKQRQNKIQKLQDKLKRS